MPEKQNKEQELIKVILKLLNAIICLLFVTVSLIFMLAYGIPDFSFPEKDKSNELIGAVDNTEIKPDDLWVAPDTSSIPATAAGFKIRYGRELIANTAFYFGPKGKIKQSTNGMNCQNCHLDAGTKPFGNNYSAVASTYPKFRERSGKIENIYKRVNDCFERSLNGEALDTLSNEMQAIKNYITWLGKDVEKNTKPKGSGLKELKFLDRAADQVKGKLVYQEKCASCHNKNGAGKMNTDNLTYQYPPLWGKESYNIGAGLFRLTRFAAYVKYNMPLGVSYNAPQLTDEEAWDVAAFVNSQPRPLRDLKKDWPKLAAKPADHPFGPYKDKFTESQHKYGPFTMIEEFKKQQKQKSK